MQAELKCAKKNPEWDQYQAKTTKIEPKQEKATQNETHINLEKPETELNEWKKAKTTKNETQTDPNWPKTTQNKNKNEPKWPKMTWNNQKQVKTSHGPKWKVNWPKADPKRFTMSQIKPK